ncbi:hypothetical protein [Rhodoligotrophos ferricapiens]|uniref:hypothetical protein n=1 Tax=Rhodoligotrophos ferricapiens TaxID=3069264 RepID=UPI00315D071D
MPDTGWLLGGAAASSGSGVAWSTPEAVLVANDASYAQASLSLFSQTSAALQVTGFDFSAIPDGVEITGIEARIRRYLGSSGAVADGNIRLVVGGTATGQNKAAAGGWPASAADATYGGAADLWTLTPTVAQVKAANFGIAIVASRDSGSPAARVTTVWMRVHYATAGFNRLSTRHAGTWNTPQPFARHAGVWKPVNGVWVRQAGSWVKLLES